MIKLLITTESLNNGGTERQISELVKGLAMSGNFKITIATLTFDGHFDAFVKNYCDLKYIANSHKWKYPSSFLKFNSLIRKEKYDIVHSFQINDSVLVFLFAFFYKFKWINGTIRDTDSSKNRRQQEKRFLLKKTRFVIANSYAGLNNYGLVPSNNIRVIYNGVDTNRAFRNFQKKDSRFNVGVIANFGYYKDHITIFKAMSLLKNNDITLHLIGSGPRLQEYQNWVTQNGLNCNVVFYGKVKKVEEIIANFDCGVLCSYRERGEGISNGVLEFMLNDIPVIATDVGAISELITDNSTGLLIQAGDYSQLAKKLCLLMSDKNFGNFLTKNAKALIQSKFGFQRMISEYIDFYNFVQKSNK